jgi:hypothetical protein
MLKITHSLNIPLEKKVVPLQESRIVKLETKNRCSNLSKSVDKTCTDMQDLTKLSQEIDFDGEAKKSPFKPTLVSGSAMIERNTEKEQGYKFIEENGGEIKNFKVVVSNTVPLPTIIQRIVGVNRKLQGKMITITPKHGNASALVSGGSYDSANKILIVAGSLQSRKEALRQEAFHAYTSQWFPVIYHTSYDRDYFTQRSDIFKNLNPAYPYSGHELEEFFSEIITLASNPVLGFSRLTNINLGGDNPGYRLIRDFATSIQGKGYNQDLLAKALVPFAQIFYNKP